MLKPWLAALALIAASFAPPLSAQEAQPCDWPARADALVEPWEDHISSFANGAVRLALSPTHAPIGVVVQKDIAEQAQEEIREAMGAEGKG